MLNFIFTLAGLLIIGGAFIGFLAPPFIANKRFRETEKAWQASGTGEPPSPPGRVGLTLTSAILIGLGGICVMTMNGAVYYAEPGYNYLVQYPTGTQIGETTPGYHFKWWGSAIPFKKFITVRASEKLDKSVSASIPSIEARFTDAVVAAVDVTARFQLPTAHDKFLVMAIAYRTQENLEMSTLIPVLREVVRNSARTMTAQDYIAGKGGEFENAILDQLRYGTYILDITEMRPEGKAKIADAETDRVIDQSQMVRYEVKKMIDPETNEIMRKPTALADYGISVTQSNVSNVDPEKKFKDMLALQRDAAAQASVKKQEAKRAEYEKQKIIAEGEASKAQIRVDQEKAQITKLIAAETAKKEAEIALQEARIQKEKEKELAEKVKIAADAEAYRKRKVLEADGALEMKLATIEAVAGKIAQGWAERPVPQTVIVTGGNATDAAQYTGSPDEVKIMLGMMLADMAKNQLSTDLSVPQGARAK
ncbi:MAG: SPFH domain-containing protein [Desulfuromonadaceae bacterium]